jgi:hypothetical protein
MTPTRLSIVVLLCAAACGKSSAHVDGGADLQPPPCVMTPTTATEILNACATSQTGSAAKDYPYYPTLAPGGALPPLP